MAQTQTQKHAGLATYTVCNTPRTFTRYPRPTRVQSKLIVPNPQRSTQLISTMAATAASDSDDDFRTRGQQPVLASQRAKQNTPTEANRTGRIGGYFPLGYKDAISQWVGTIHMLEGSNTD